MVLGHYFSFSAPQILDVIDDFGRKVELNMLPGKGFDDPTYQACHFSHDGFCDPAYFSWVWSEK